MDRSCRGSSGVNEMHSPSRTTQWDVCSLIESLEWHPSLLVPIVPLVPMDHRNCPVPSQVTWENNQSPLNEMHIHQQNHWNDILFYWYQSYHWYQWTIGLTNRIRLCILDICETSRQYLTSNSLRVTKKKNWEALRSSSAFFYMMTTGTKSVKKNNNWKKTEIITSPTDKDAGFSMLSAVQSDYVLFFMATIVSTKTMTSLRLRANFKLYIFKLKVCNLIKSNFREQAIHVYVRHLS